MSDVAMHALGVPGCLTHRTTKPGQAPGLWFKQRWISESRLVAGYGKGAMIRAEIRFDDEFGNGHNTFAITGEVRTPGRRDVSACGCLHDDIAAVFPELAPLVLWHLASTDGPMHYLANTVHLAGDRDHNGLRKGETRPLRNRDGKPMWNLVAINAPGISLSDTPTGQKYADKETAPLFILTDSYTGATPPATPQLEWRIATRIGEGKVRELDAARRIAAWPEATDEDLCAEPDVLRAALTVRLPDLLRRFRDAMKGAGLLWEPGAE